MTALADAKEVIEAHNAEVKADLTNDYVVLKQLVNEFCAALDTMVAMDDPQLAAVKAVVLSLKMQFQMQGSQIESYFTVPVQPMMP